MVWHTLSVEIIIDMIVNMNMQYECNLNLRDIEFYCPPFIGALTLLVYSRKKNFFFLILRDCIEAL